MVSNARSAGQRQRQSQPKEYTTLPVLEIYPLEKIPLDGCVVIGDNDVGLFWSEITGRGLYVKC
jgi:hypothetical protein